MRLSRPSITQLNPYINDSNPNFIRTGNPNLDAMTVHIISLNYGYFAKKFNLNANLAQRFTDNSILQTTRIENGVSTSTYENIGKMRGTLLSAYFNWSPEKWFKLYSNLGGTYVNMSANDGSLPTRDIFYSWGAGGFECRLPWKIWLIGNVMGNLPHKNLQTTTLQHQLALRKNFAKNRLNTRIYAQNPFVKNYKRSITTENPTFYQEENLCVSRQYFGFNISYRFGELKTKLKKTAKSIENDDVMGDEQNNEQNQDNEKKN